MAIEYRPGKLELPEPPEEFVAPRLVRDGIAPLPVTHRHAAAVATLPDHHRDPFHRLLVAKAPLEDLRLATAAPRIRGYDVSTLSAASSRGQLGCPTARLELADRDAEANDRIRPTGPYCRARRRPLP